jgi:hypothetical protein
MKQTNRKIFRQIRLSLLAIILLLQFTGCNVIKSDLLMPQLLVLRKALASVGIGSVPENPVVATIEAPIFSPAAGTYTTTQSIAISTTTTGAILCYTTDGSNPSCHAAPSCSNGTLYSSPVSIATTTTLKALACKAGNLVSAVGTGSYTIGGLGDTTPPTVSSTLPADSTTNISTSATISITFSEPINAATLTTITSSGACAGSIQVSSDNFATCIGMTAIAPTMSGGDTVATITPLAMLAGGTIYKIRVTITVTDYSSNALLSTYTTATGFTTGSPPSALTYTGSPYSYTQNVVIATNTPMVSGTVTNCTSSPAMPSGLSLDTTTCAITGTPTIAFSATGYTITASNAFGNTVANIVLEVINPCTAGPVSNKISYITVDTSSAPNIYKAIVSNLDGSSACAVYTISTIGSAMNVVKFSPDNTKLLLLHSSTGPVYHISTINVDGTGFQTLRSSATFPNWAYGAWAEWFDNTSYLYSENGHVYKSNLDGTGNGIYINYTSIGITGGSDGIGAMTLSPDGTSIMFMNHGPGNTYHYLYKINSDGVTGFTDLGVYSYNGMFFYSPDSSKISYPAFSGTWQNYYANANGTSQTNINAFFAGVGMFSWYDNTAIFYFNNITKILDTKNYDGTGNVTRFTVGASEQILNLDYTLPVATVLWNDTTRPRITTWDASSFTTSWGSLASAVNYKIYYWTTVWNYEQTTTSTSVVFNTNINSARKICAVDSGAVEYQCMTVFPTWRNGYPDLPSREISGTFFDDFSDASIGTAFAQIRPAQMTEGSGYLQLNQNITDMGPAVGLYYNRGNFRYMRISWKHFAHRAGNYFTASLALQEVTLGLQWLYHGMWYYDYNSPPFDIPCYGWCNNVNGYSDNMVYSRTPNTVLSGTQIFDAWMDAEVVVDFVAGTVTSKLNGTMLASTPIRTDWGSKIALQFSPYGWGTGHYIRIDDLSIQSQNTPFP